MSRCLLTVGVLLNPDVRLTAGEAGSLPLSALPLCVAEAGLSLSSISSSLSHSLPFKSGLCSMGVRGKHRLLTGVAWCCTGSKGLSCFSTAAIGPAHPSMEVHTSAS